LPALTAVEKRFLFPAIRRQLRAILLGVMVCYFWLLPKTILFFFVIPSRSAGRQHGRCNSIILSWRGFTIGFGLALNSGVVLALVRLINHLQVQWRAPGRMRRLILSCDIITPSQTF